MMWIAQHDLDEIISHLPELEVAAFNLAKKTVLSGYGRRKRYWWSAPNNQRIQRDAVDGESIDVLMERLQRYDARNPFVWFFQRFFTSIETQRNMLCYWAFKQLSSKRLCALQTQTATPRQQSTVLQALAVLRLQAPLIQSKTLREPLSNWNFISAIERALPIFTAWMLSFWRKPNMPAIKSKMLVNEQAVQHLGKHLSQAAHCLRDTYVNIELDSKARQSTIKTLWSRLERDYKNVLTQAPTSQQLELKQIYKQGVVALKEEADNYTARLLRPIEYLQTSSQKEFQCQASLSLEQQWQQHDQLELNIRFSMVEKLLHQSWPTKSYETVKNAVHTWLNQYIYPMLSTYLAVAQKDFAQYQALYQSIQMYLATQVTQLLSHETRQKQRTIQAIQNHNLWLSEWSALMAPVLDMSQIVSKKENQNLVASPELTPCAIIKVEPKSTTSISLATNLLTTIATSTTTITVETNSDELLSVNTEKTVAEWQAQWQHDLAALQAQRKLVEQAIQRALQQNTKIEAKAVFESGLKALTKLYRVFAHRYHPDKICVKGSTTEEAHQLGESLFKELQQQKVFLTQSLENVLNNRSTMPATSMDDVAYNAALDELIASYRKMNAELEKQLSEIRETIKKTDEIIKKTDESIKRTDEMLCKSEAQKRTAHKDLETSREHLRKQERLTENMKALEESTTELKENMEVLGKKMEVSFQWLQQKLSAQPLAVSCSRHSFLFTSKPLVDRQQSVALEKVGTVPILTLP